MITVAGVVFSITIVALSLTSSQYTPRVLRNFMRDSTNQVVMGVFVGIFAYCLVVLRSIRGGNEGIFVPSLAVLGGLALAFVGIAYLIDFIHHISISIQASSIIASAAEETMVAVDHLFPDDLGDSAEDGASDESLLAGDGETWGAVNAWKSGYLESMDKDGLLAFARNHGTVVRMERAIGEFVIEGCPVLSIAGVDTPSDEQTNELKSVYVISRQRTVQQDAGFGVRQIVDIALKALSPGVNDFTTAVMCVEYLGAILCRLVARRIASPHHLDQEELRVITRGPNVDSLLAQAFDEIRQNAAGNVTVLTRQLQMLETISSRTTNLARQQALRQQGTLIAEIADRTVISRHDQAVVRSASDRLCRLVGATVVPRDLKKNPS